MAPPSLSDDPGGKLGILAGGGDLPVLLVDACKAQNRDFYISCLSETDARLDSLVGDRIGIGQIGKRLKALHDAGVKTIVLAGYVSRPDFKSLAVDTRGAMMLPGVLRAAAKGDDSIMSHMIKQLEKEGFSVIGPDALLEPLLAEDGLIAGAAPDAACEADITKAAETAAVMGKLDIGQGAVSCRGVILAVEAQEGTDLMLERVARLPEPIRGTAVEKKGVLVKRPKPQQERRVDLPVIGPSTVEKAAAAHLAGIAVAAGEVFVLYPDEVKAKAEEAGMFVLGRRFPPGVDA